MSAPATNMAARLTSVLGAAQVSVVPQTCQKYQVDDFVPSVVAKPASAEAVAETVRLAKHDHLSLIPCGGCTKLGIGMPPARYDIAVDMTGLQQIAHYDRDDLTLSIDAGIGLAELGVVLRAQNQFLPLSVPFLEKSTVGGTIASGIGSALRYSYGSARDFLIGAEFINGSGALTRSGGRVVKNVTGYDLHKLLIGSLGSLGIITRLNFRTFPLPEKRAHFVAAFSSLEAVRQFHALATKSHLKPSAMDVLDPEAARLFFPFRDDRASPNASWISAGDWHVCIAVEGTEAIIRRYSAELGGYAEQAQAVRHTLLEEAANESFANAHGELLNRIQQDSTCVTIFSISVLPVLPSNVLNLRGIADRHGIPSSLIATGSGPLYFALLPQTLNEAGMVSLNQVAAEVFDFAAAHNGSASILFCPPKLKAILNIWGPPRSDAPLMRRLKAAFDPGNIFAPGRFVAGI